MTSDAVTSALAAARLRAIRPPLLALHKTLIDVERERYERAHGRIESSGAALRLLLEDPWFAWLRPMAQLIVQIDERLAGDEPVRVTDLDAVMAGTRALLRTEASGQGFHEAYRRVLQESPEAVVAHGRVMAALTAAH
jgi:hypothetical protein